MPTSDPVGDMIARIKNGHHRRHKRISLPHSRMKEGVAKVLQAEGYLADVKVTTDEKKAWNRTLHLYLKYDDEGRPVIGQIRRVSRPGCRIFRGVSTLGKVQDGLGISVLSTSKGILSDRQARKQKVGGEMVCKVW
jgi:small subunit ribosomal protein S8